jgi:hypothetical protein
LQFLSEAKATELFQDPTWTKAVFIRDPAERLLSAYRDKIEKRRYTKKHFGIDRKRDDGSDEPLNFTEFVHLVTDATSMLHLEVRPRQRRGLSWYTEPHWAPQLFTCGLETTFPLYDFVGNLDFLAQHTKALLERVGLWNDFGSQYINADTGEGACVIAPPKVTRSDNVTRGFNQYGATTHHVTGSRNLHDKYYTPALLAKVKTAYAMDYIVWDEIKDRPNLTTPSDLAHIQKICF